MEKSYITKPIMVADEVNRNGRIYSRSVLEKAAEEFNDRFNDQHPMLGELDQPSGLEGGKINLDRVSHKVEKLFLKDDELMARIVVMDTPMGNILKTLAKEIPDNISLQMRGRGVVQDTGYVSDFDMITVDVCAARQGRKQTDEEWFEHVMSEMGKDKLI